MNSKYVSILISNKNATRSRQYGYGFPPNHANFKMLNCHSPKKEAPGAAIAEPGEEVTLVGLAMEAGYLLILAYRLLKCIRFCCFGQRKLAAL